MKKNAVIVFAITLLMCAFTATAKNTVVPKMYIFGFSASFTDSIVYFTEIQEIDSAWVNDKSKFLVNRNEYSYQLRDYLKEQGHPNRTCITTYAFERKDIEKKYLKMKEIYSNDAKKNKKRNRQYDVKLLTLSDFKYEAVASYENDGYEEEPKVKEKKQKKSKKKQAAPPKKEEETSKADSPS